jgi:RimJ/RimL family protein N-acetyltransferase
MAWAQDSSPSSLSEFLAQTSARWDRGERFEYAIRGADVPSGRAGGGTCLLGGAGLMARIAPGGLEIGYWVDRLHTRRRIATRAAATLTAAAFTLDGVECVEIRHDEANGASAGVPALLGFGRVGTFPVASRGLPAETGREVRWRLQASTYRAGAAGKL